MNISPVNAYGYQARAYMPRFQGTKNLSDKLATSDVYIETPKHNIETKVEGLKIKLPPSDIPLKDPNLPDTSKLSHQETIRNIEHAGKKIEDSKTGLTYKYNENGYVHKVFDSKDKCVRKIYRNETGTVYGYSDYVNDTNGNTIRDIYRKADGSVRSYSDYVLDANGNKKRVIFRDSEGEIFSSTDYILDSNGNFVKAIEHSTNDI